MAPRETMRTAVLHIRLTPAEMKRVEQHAARFGRSVSEYARACLQQDWIMVGDTDAVADVVQERTANMTQEELEFLAKHPGFPEALVSGFLAELKRGRAIKEGAKLAKEHGIVTKAVGGDGRLRRGSS
jgi:hypothetical protein